MALSRRTGLGTKMKNNKSLGQHWLKNRAILDTIADLAAVEDSDNVVCVEIGPGLGTLTSSLLKRFEKVIAIEFDKRLATNLPKSFPGKNLEVIQADILKTNVVELIPDGKRYVVVGNIPYYITSPIIRQMLELSLKPEKIVLLIQKEVAERVAALPGDHSILSLTTQNLAEVTLGPIVRAEEFTPPPKVDSQVIVLAPRGKALVSDGVIDLAKRGFSSPRKKLAHNLAGFRSHSKVDWQELMLPIVNVDARAEDLSLEEWQLLDEASA